jgi:hypothetical protein
VPYDYSRYFGEITLTHDLTTLPGERRLRLAPPGRGVERHRIVLYLGCNVLRTSHMVQTVTAIFGRRANRVDPEGARRFVRETFAARPAPTDPAPS